MANTASKKLVSKQKELENLQMQIRQMEEALHHANRNEYAISIALKNIPARKVVSFRDKIHKFSEEGMLWTKLNEECSRLGVKVSALSLAIAVHHGVSQDETGHDVEVQLTVDKMMEDTQYLKFREIPECEAASITVQGGYSKLGDINRYVAEWIEQNGYEIADNVFSIYHSSPKNETDENNFITEVCFPIRFRAEKIS